ncbi:MAG: PRC-barrel domain-containing protein [Phaeodactylibacter sp.]|nr:PRC-barrel domain-containing protein [Phaeodactylibacter sp.]
MQPKTLSSSSIDGTSVVNPAGESLGHIKDLMIDLKTGLIAYAVVSHGGILGIGDKYFAIPWEALRINTKEETFILDVSKEKFDQAPGFDKDNWPTGALHEYLTDVYAHFGYKPYWN